MATVPAFMKELYADVSLRTNCSGFFKAVADRVGVLTPEMKAMRADPLIDHVSRAKAQWVEIGQGPAAGTKAAGYAAQGYLVVALLKAADHLPFKRNPGTGKYDIPHPYSSGHLSVVLPGPTLDGYPYVISGSTVDDGRSDGSKAVRGVWRGVDAPQVRYYRTNDTFPLLMPAAK